MLPLGLDDVHERTNGSKGIDNLFVGRNRLVLVDERFPQHIGEGKTWCSFEFDHGPSPV